jgi:hypothetical protein
MATLAVALALAGLAAAQSIDDDQPMPTPAGADSGLPRYAGSWRTPGRMLPDSGAPGRSPRADLASPAAHEEEGDAPSEPGLKRLSPSSAPASAARVTGGSGKLPNDQGQVWREYDISSYTARVTNTKQPQQAIIDWILRETGYEAWHSDAVSVLNADRQTLRVYHTPDVQRTVADIVDRFVGTGGETHTFSLRVVTVGNPNWRETTVRMLRPIPVQSQGVQAWLLAKEDAALLLAQMGKRSDFREYTSPNLVIHNGQPSQGIGASRTRRYAKGVIMRPGSAFGFEMEMGQIDEGYSLQVHPLLSLDGGSVDAVIKCQINQIEKMIPVTLELPTIGAPTQRQTIEIPQLSSSDLHERFRWPTDQVLLISRGVVATPVPKGPSLLPISLPGSPSGNRADALVFIQSNGKPPSGAPTPTPSGIRTSQRYHGRY